MYKLIFLIVILNSISSNQKTYKINLDSPLDERWVEFTTDYKVQIINFFKFLDKKFDLPNWCLYIIEIYSRLFRDQDIIQQIDSISKILGIQAGKLLLLNYSYESYIGCTSIIAKNSKGQIIHGRNFDYYYPQIYASITSQAIFYKNNKEIFRGPILGGFIGTHTIMKNEQFSISLNDRNQVQHISIFYTLFKLQIPIPYMILYAGENFQNYQQAKNYFKTQDFQSTAYIILAGISEGSVITRDFQQVKIESLNDQKWFIVQTNYDRDKKDPKNDYRRIPAEEKMIKIGQDRINEINIGTDVLFQQPNNNNLTIESIIMSPERQIYNQKMWL